MLSKFTLTLLRDGVFGGWGGRICTLLPSYTLKLLDMLADPVFVFVFAQRGNNKCPGAMVTLETDQRP